MPPALLYAPGTTQLNCNYCGHTEDIIPLENDFEELELKEYLNDMGGQSRREEISIHSSLTARSPHLRIAKKIFGTENDRTLKKLRPLVASIINALEPQFEKMTDDALQVSFGYMFASNMGEHTCAGAWKRSSAQVVLDTRTSHSIHKLRWGELLRKDDLIDSRQLGCSTTNHLCPRHLKTGIDVDAILRLSDI